MTALRNLDASQNSLSAISAPFHNPRLETLNLAKNNLRDVFENAFTALASLKSLDLRENSIRSFFSFPKTETLETVLISFNCLVDIGGFSNSPNIVTFDLKNNKLTQVPEEIFYLKKMKILDLSNNDLQNLPAELGLLKGLNKLQIEGNPLRSIRMAVRQGGTEVIKKYLASKISDADIEKKHGHDPKAALIKEEFQQKASHVSKLVQLVRQMKNTNGDLDLRSKSLTDDDINEDILVADRVKCLDMSDNRLTRVPQLISRLGPTSLKVNNNQIARVDVPDIVDFAGLREIEMRGNKMTAFCDHFTSKQDIVLMRMNFAQLSFLDLSQNSLSRVPGVVHELPGLRNLVLAYNNIGSVQDLFREGSLPSIDHLDLGNNSIAEIPPHIYKWQSLTSLVVQNNSIKNFPPELGYLNLKNLNIAGNPSLLLKASAVHKGPMALLTYLKDKVVNKRQIEQEIASMQSQRPTPGLPPKRPTDLDEYQFEDPFKRRAADYQKHQDQRYGEIYEEDLKDHLSRQRPTRMDEERGYGGGLASPQRGNPMDIEVASQANSQQSRHRFEQEIPGRQNHHHGQNHNADLDRRGKDLDDKIKTIQGRIENDFTLSKVKVAELKKELAQLKIERNSLFR